MSPTEPDKPLPPRPRWTVISVALFVVGLLILVPSGLCTGVVGILSLMDGISGFGEFLVVVLPIAGIPVLLGAFLVYIGLKARRRD